MAKGYSLDRRRRVFGAWQGGAGSQGEIAARFAVSVSFGRDLSRRFRESGDVSAKPYGGGRTPSVDAATREAIKALGAARHGAAIEEHRQSLAGAGCPLGHFDARPLAAQARTPAQKKTPGDDERQTERVQALRAESAAVAPEQLVFREESGVNRAMTRPHARRPRGRRAYGSAPRNRGDHVSILGALCLRGTLGADVRRTGPPTGRSSLASLDHGLAPQLWPEAVVVRDHPGRAHGQRRARAQRGRRRAPA